MPLSAERVWRQMLCMALSTTTLQVFAAHGARVAVFNLWQAVESRSCRIIAPYGLASSSDVLMIRSKRRLRDGACPVPQHPDRSRVRAIAASRNGLVDRKPTPPLPRGAITLRRSVVVLPYLTTILLPHNKAAGTGCDARDGGMLITLDMQMHGCEFPDSPVHQNARLLKNSAIRCGQ